MKELIEREEAVLKLCDLTNNNDMPEEWHVGVSAAISALFKVPTAKRNCFTCGMGGDTYNPEQVNEEVLKKNDRAVSLAKVCKIIRDTYEVSPATWGELRALPNASTKRGEWIEIGREIVAYPSKWSNEDEREPVEKVDIMCSNCGGIHSFVGKRWTDFDFCPLCGSDNRKGESDE